ncbi:hypothetical protein GWN42_31445 [candidate division KSB1 bacterium]|nr:hypothetical protein [candidate division KSB1 bacterium]
MDSISNNAIDTRAGIPVRCSITSGIFHNFTLHIDPDTIDGITGEATKKAVIAIIYFVIPSTPSYSRHAYIIYRNACRIGYSPIIHLVMAPSFAQPGNRTLDQLLF